MRQNFNIFAMQCQGESTKSIAIKSVFKIREWQGRLDSNQRMPRSKPGALPLGDAPKFDDVYDGRGGWIRTNGCRDQNPVPYHLATPLI